MNEANKSKTVITTDAKNQVLDSIFDKMSTTYSIPKANIKSVLENTAFKMSDNKGKANDAEMVSLLSVATKYDLNPFTKEIYAFRSKSGVIHAVVSIDGWISKIIKNEKFQGFKINYPDEIKTKKIGGKDKSYYEWVEVEINIQGLEEPIIIKEFFDECYFDPFPGCPWDTHPKRMLRHKAMIQAARYAFGLGGVYDSDEIQRIEKSEHRPS